MKILSRTTHTGGELRSIDHYPHLEGRSCTPSTGLLHHHTALSRIAHTAAKGYAFGINQHNAEQLQVATRTATIPPQAVNPTTTIVPSDI